MQRATPPPLPISAVSITYHRLSIIPFIIGWCRGDPLCQMGLNLRSWLGALTCMRSSYASSYRRKTSMGWSQILQSTPLMNKKLLLGYLRCGISDKQNCANCRYPRKFSEKTVNFTHWKTNSLPNPFWKMSCSQLNR